MFILLLRLGACRAYLLSSYLDCFSFRFFFNNAQPQHPVFKTSAGLAIYR